MEASEPPPVFSKNEPKFPVVHLELPTRSLHAFIESELFPAAVPIECLGLAGTCCCCLLDFVGTDEEDRRAEKQLLIAGEGPSSWIGLINCCSHSFHHDCIIQWSRRENSCPQCKLRCRVEAAYSRTGQRILYQKIRHANQKDALNEVEETQGCFVCHINGPQGTCPLVQCEGNTGDCQETCHFRCLGLPAELAAGSFTWCCPSCIRQQRCTNAENERITLYSRRLITQFQLPTISAAPIEVLSSSQALLQPFLDLYAYVSCPPSCSSRTSRSARRARRPSPAVRSITRGRTRQAPASRRRSCRSAIDAAINRAAERLIQEAIDATVVQPSSDDVELVSEEPTATPLVEAVVVPDFSVTLLSRRREEETVETTDESRLQEMIRSELNIDELYEEDPPTIRGVPSNFEEYERYERHVLGHSSYGKSELASRQEDGGCLSGRDFLATLLSKQTPAEEEWESWEITRKRRRIGGNNVTSQASSSRRSNGSPIDNTKRSGHAESSRQPSTSSSSRPIEQRIDSSSSRQRQTSAASSSVWDDDHRRDSSNNQQHAVSSRQTHLTDQRNLPSNDADDGYAGQTRSLHNRRRLKPTQGLVEHIKRALQPAGLDRDTFREVCRATAESLWEANQDRLSEMSTRSCDAFWNRRRDQVVLETGRQLERISSKRNVALDNRNNDDLE